MGYLPVRPANRPSFGPQLSLRAILFAVAFLPLGAHADVFGSGQSGDLAKRLQQLEQTVTELQNNAQSVSSGGAQAPGLTAPPPPPEVVSEFSAPEGYVVLAEVNGRTLLREGERRLLLTPEEFHRYKEEAQRKAAAEKAQAALGMPPGAPGLNTPPPPPPGAAPQPTAPAKAAPAKSAADPAAPTSGPRPVTPKNAKSANSK